MIRWWLLVALLSPVIVAGLFLMGLAVAVNWVLWHGSRLYWP